MERIKRIALMCVGYILLFTCITWFVAILRGQSFRFDLYLDLIAAVLCGVATDFLPKAESK